MSIRLVGLGAMSAPPPRRRCVFPVVFLMAAGAWFPFVLILLWVRGLL